MEFETTGAAYIIAKSCDSESNFSIPSSSKLLVRKDTFLAYRNIMITKMIYLLVMAAASELYLWYRDQPNDFNRYQECLAMVPSNEYKWGDEKCLNQNSYICQYSK